MNERIIELAEQSMLVYKDGDKLLTGWMSYVDLSEYIEKFAELIVRECADVAFLEANSRKTVLQHFGVEE